MKSFKRSMLYELCSFQDKKPFSISFLYLTLNVRVQGEDLQQPCSQWRGRPLPWKYQGNTDIANQHSCFYHSLCPQVRPCPCRYNGRLVGRSLGNVQDVVLLFHNKFPTVHFTKNVLDFCSTSFTFIVFYLKCRLFTFKNCLLH